MADHQTEAHEIVRAWIGSDACRPGLKMLLRAEAVGPLIAAIAAALERGNAARSRPERVRHVKRGTFYTVNHRDVPLQSGEPIAEGEPLVVYQGDDGQVWCRPAREFDDGRFEPAAAIDEASGALRRSS